MKKIVLKLYEFDELSKDSQERIIEREHWNVMEQCMDAYGIDYKKSMKAFEDMTDTRGKRLIRQRWRKSVPRFVSNMTKKSERRKSGRR